MNISAKKSSVYAISLGTGLAVFLCLLGAGNSKRFSFGIGLITACCFQIAISSRNKVVKNEKEEGNQKLRFPGSEYQDVELISEDPKACIRIYSSQILDSTPDVDIDLYLKRGGFHTAIIMNMKMQLKTSQKY